jgi:hypothetical protein
MVLEINNERRQKVKIKSSIKMLIIAEFIQVDSGIEVVPMKV